MMITCRHTLTITYYTSFWENPFQLGGGCRSIQSRSSYFSKSMTIFLPPDNWIGFAWWGPFREKLILHGFVCDWELRIPFHQWYRWTWVGSPLSLVISIIASSILLVISCFTLSIFPSSRKRRCLNRGSTAAANTRQLVVSSCLICSAVFCLKLQIASSKSDSLKTIYQATHNR